MRKKHYLAMFIMKSEDSVYPGFSLEPVLMTLELSCCPKTFVTKHLAELCLSELMGLLGRLFVKCLSV